MKGLRGISVVLLGGKHLWVRQTSPCICSTCIKTTFTLNCRVVVLLHDPQVICMKIGQS